MEQRATTGVLLAVIIAACLLLGSLLYSNWKPFLNGEEATAPTTEMATPERVTTNTTSDSEEWRSTLARTQTAPQPNTSNSADTPDPSSRPAPDTLTAQFGNALATDVLFATDEEPSPEATQAAIDEVVADIIAQTREELYTENDIIVVPSTTENRVTYLNEVASTIQRLAVVDGPNEGDLFQRALEDGDVTAYAELRAISDVYADLRDAYLDIPAPEAYAKTHTDITNVFNMLHAGLRDIAAAPEDPLRAYIRSQRYLDDARGLNFSLMRLGAYTYQQQEQLAEDAPAWYFAQFLQDLDVTGN